jgi:hypothetical protein
VIPDVAGRGDRPPQRPGRTRDPLRSRGSVHWAFSHKVRDAGLRPQWEPSAAPTILPWASRSVPPPGRATQPQDLADPHRARDRDPRLRRVVPQHTPAPQRARHSRASRIRNQTTTQPTPSPDSRTPTPKNQGQIKACAETGVPQNVGCAHLKAAGKARVGRMGFAEPFGGRGDARCGVVTGGRCPGWHHARRMATAETQRCGHRVMRVASRSRTCNGRSGSTMDQPTSGCTRRPMRIRSVSF